MATAAGRDDTLPALTGVRIEIEGDTLTLISTDRYRLAVRELRWNPARPDLAPRCWSRPGRSAETARALTSGAEVSIALALGRAATRADRLRGRRAADHDPAARRRVPRTRRCCPTRSTRWPNWRPAVRRGGQAGRPGRRAQHRGPAVVHPGPAGARGGHRRRGPGGRGARGGFEGEDLQIAFNPQYLLDGLTAIDSDTARISFTEPGKPALITGKPARTSSPTTATC